MSTHDLMAHEKLNRPIISTFQRHPGNNMPEAQEIVRVCDLISFLSSLELALFAIKFHLHNDVLSCLLSLFELHRSLLRERDTLALIRRA